MSRRSKIPLSHQGDLPPNPAPGAPESIFGSPFGLYLAKRPQEAPEDESEKLPVDLDKDGWFRESMARHTAVQDPNKYRVHPICREVLQHIDGWTGAVCLGREEEAVRHLATMKRVTDWVAYAEALRRGMIEALAADAGFYRSEQERKKATWEPIKAALALEKPGAQPEVADDE